MTTDSPIIVMAASTGGPDALKKILTDIPVDICAPIVIVQHMTEGFTSILAKDLNEKLPWVCKEALSGEVLSPGHLYMAPTGVHVYISGTQATPVVTLHEGELINYCCPSADPLFQSASKVYKERTIGVVLTGMGKDGTEGCRAIMNAGGQVLVQDEASSLIWGMPKSVVQAGVYTKIVPLQRMGEELSMRVMGTKTV